MNLLACFLFIPPLLYSQINKMPSFILIPDLSKISSVNVTNDIISHRDVVKCECDKVHYLCDKYCCCDPKCNATIVDSWKKGLLCDNLKANPSMSDFPLCDKMKSSIQDKQLYFNQINHLTCLYFVNAPYNGFFLNELKLATPPSNPQSYFAQPYIDSTEKANEVLTGQTYNPGVNILQSDSTKQFIVLFLLQIVCGFLHLISLDYAKNTNPSNSQGQSLCKVAFVIQQTEIFDQFFNCQPYSCPASTDTTSPFQISYYVKQIKITPGSATTVSPTVTSTLTAGDTPKSDYCSCDNMVKSIRWEITVKGANISSIKIVPTYVNNVYIKCSESTAVIPPTQVVKPQSPDALNAITQEFEVVWILESSQQIEAIPRSGTPGYLPLYPLLVGYKVQNSESVPKDFILRERKFYIQGADLSGMCTQNEGVKQELKFNQNMEIQCSLTLNYATFGAFCNKKTQELKKYVIFQNFDSKSREYPTGKNQQGQIYFGIYGNANFSLISDWVPIEQNDTFYSLINTDMKATCATPAVQVVTFFYSKTGVVGNLQNYIVKVQQSYPPNSIWQWNVLQTQTQTFPVILKIYFVELTQSQLEFKQRITSNAFTNYVNVKVNYIYNFILVCILIFLFRWIQT